MKPEFWRPKDFLTFQRALKLSLCPVKTFPSLQTELHLCGSFSFVWGSAHGSVSMLFESVHRSEISVRTDMPPSGPTVIPSVFLHQTKISALSIFTGTPSGHLSPRRSWRVWHSLNDRKQVAFVRGTPCREKSESKCYHLEVILDVPIRRIKMYNMFRTFPFIKIVSKRWNWQVILTNNNLSILYFY